MGINKGELFGAIATKAMELGYEITLEEKNYESESKTFGSFANNKGLDTGLVLRAFPPAPDDNDAEDEEE